MTKNEELAHKLYEKVINKETVRIEFLWNAFCYFEVEPEEVISIINKLSDDDRKTLDIEFSTVRKQVRKALGDALSSYDFHEDFHNPEIEDILFYQVSHGYPIG